MNRYILSLWVAGFSLTVFVACNGSGSDIKKSDTAEVYQFPIAPAPADTSGMVQPLPADSEHLEMPVRPMPDTGRMPVKEPEPGIKPM